MNQRKLTLTLLLADLVWALVAMAGAIVLRYGTHWNVTDLGGVRSLLPYLEAAVVIWAFLSAVLPLDGFRGGWRASAVVSHLLLSVGGMMLFLLSCGYLFRSYVSRLALCQFGLLLFAGFLGLRFAFHRVLLNRSSNGSAKRVVIVGGGRLVRELVNKIQHHPEMLWRVIGFLSKDDGTADSVAMMTRHGATTSSSVVGIVDVLCEQRVDELILALEEGLSPDLSTMARMCRDRGIRVSLVPHLYELYLSRSCLIDLGGLPILQLANPGLSDAALLWKRAFDVFLGMVLSLFAAPILLPLALAVRYRTGRAFRWEERCGLQGKPFLMLRLNVDRKGEIGSKFDKILRDLSLSELPQLWNVLRGDMSLVGPRPESAQRVVRYSEWHKQRLAMKPGITGLAQVQGLREQHPSEDKTRFDLQYVLNCSPWTDLSLLLQTVWTLVMRSVHRDGFVPEIDNVITIKPVAPPVQSEILENAHRS
jgi:lipopolysaccharide/colanic/teichoic acid biosynthesis glycosyltransferase